MSQNFDPNAFFDAYYRSTAFKDRFIEAAFTGLPLTPMSPKRRFLNVRIGVERLKLTELDHLRSKRLENFEMTKQQMSKAYKANERAEVKLQRAKNEQTAVLKRLIADKDVLAQYPRDGTTDGTLKMIEDLKKEYRELMELIDRIGSRRETTVEKIDDRTFRVSPSQQVFNKHKDKFERIIPEALQSKATKIRLEIDRLQTYLYESEVQRVSTHPKAVGHRKGVEALTRTRDASKAKRERMGDLYFSSQHRLLAVEKEITTSKNALIGMERLTNQMAGFEEKKASRVLKKQRRIAARAEAALSKPNEVLSEPITRASHFHRTPGIALLHAAPVISTAPASAPLKPIRLLPTSRLGKQVALGAAVVGAVAGLRFGRTDGVQPQQPQGPSAEGMQIRDFLQRDG